MPTRCLGCADSKGASQKWILGHVQNEVDHLFKSNDHISSGGGFCLKHGQNCLASNRPVDIGSGGFPCQAFSSKRWKGGGTVGTGATENHSLFDVPMGGLPSYMRARRPAVFFLEEVVGFNKKVPAIGGFPMHILGREIAKLGYAVRAFFLDTTAFIDVPRVRIFMIFVHNERGGGSTGADWIAAAIREMLAHCRLMPPARFIDICDPDGPSETSIRQSEVS